MNNIVKYFCILSMLLTLSSCDDFFGTDPDNIINAKDYISKNDEAYKGFMGILTRMQTAGDQSIFLTDTRGDYLEITPNAPVPLQNIYNYEETNGNAYADPTPYYSVIVACNDFIDKLRIYREKNGSSLDEKTNINYNAMVSSALRIKVWAYYTLGRIYGKAVWFDSPMEDLTNLNDNNVFTKLNDMPSIVEACVNLLDNGIKQNGINIPANLDMNWVAYLDEETQNVAQYEYWKYLTPNFMLLKFELLSWRGTQADWLWVRDNILLYMDVQRKAINNVFLYSCCIPLTDVYYQIFYNERIGSTLQLISGIMYDYNNNQKNRLVQYFCPDYPGDGYYLRPSTFGISKYIDSDIRSLTQRLVMNTINGKTSFSKYFYFRGSYLRSKIFEIQPTVILQRGHDLHFLLAEAENHLGNWRQAQCILNNGISNEFPSTMPATWNPNYALWFAPGATGYGDNGIVGCVRGKSHYVPKPTDADYNITEEQRIKLYDLALLDEYLLEYTGEGKSYSYMVKMAQRYGEASIVADRVCPKYPTEMQEAVRSKILAGGYWVNWDLNGDNK